MSKARAVPPLVLNLRWNVLAWNRIHSLFHRDCGASPAGERNLLEILFTRPERHRSPEQLRFTAQRLLARRRFDDSKFTGEPKREALVCRLSSLPPLFNRIWRLPERTLRSLGPHRFTRARFGPVMFEHNSSVPDGTRGAAG